MSEAVASAEMPLRLGTPEEFARVRDALRAAQFDDPTVCRILKLDDMSDLGRARAETTDFAALTPELGLFVKLFLFAEPLARTEVERVLAPETLAAFLALDLLRLGEIGGEAKYWTPVFFYPVLDLRIASDRQTSPDGTPFEPPPDIVFPAIYVGTLRFLRMVMRAPGAEALDLCAGSGVGAIALSPFFRRVVSADLTARAAHFARFNALLNGRENVEVVAGDLFEPVAGRRFDSIIAHPPYMPSFDNQTIWRDGGATGEFLIRRIIAETPPRLNPGGTLYLNGLGIDTSDAPHEERVRQWLGAESDEFDVIFGYGYEKSPEEVAREVTKRAGSDDPAMIARMEEVFREIKAVRFLNGALVIRRRTAEESGDPWTARFTLSPATDGAAFVWALAWGRLRARADFRERLRSLRPHLSPHLEVSVTHRVNAGELLPAEFVMKTERPFSAAVRFDGWAVPLAAEFNGQLTPPEVYAKARAAAALPEDFMLEDFLSLVTMMIERGFLALAELPKM